MPHRALSAADLSRSARLPIFDGIKERDSLALAQSTADDSGLVTLRYRPT